MVEYIDRQAAIEIASGYCHPANIAAELAKLPAADVRPVVLCRDCRNWEYDAIFFDGWCRGRQQGNPNWYCADGEKREES